MTMRRPVNCILFRWSTGFLALFFSLIATRSQAQTFGVDVSTIAGGGGTSTGSVYSVSGTIGQADAGATLNGGRYSVDGGFWSVIAAVQSPGAPFLGIRLTTTNTVFVSWPSPSMGYKLEECTDLATGNWTEVGMTPADDGTTRSVVVSPPTGNRFYRLHKQ